MSFLTIYPHIRTQERTQEPFYLSSEEEASFEAGWDPEAISQDEANKYVADLEARIVAKAVAQKEPLSPPEERIYSRIITAARIEEYRLEDIARAKRTEAFLLALKDPKNNNF